MNSAPDQTPDAIDPASLTKDPPTTLMGILKSLGPGLIIAGSIVGSGELIATTSTGAAAGFSLLWLIIIGCVIKVFVQVELGRYTIVTGTTTISGLASLPGPRVAGTHLIVWYWFIMFIAIMGRLGGIVGGVGQALSISIPVTERGRTYNLYREAETQLTVLRGQWASDQTDAATKQALVKQISPLQAQSIDNYLLLSGTNRSQQEKDRLTKLKGQLASLSEAPAGSPEHHLYTQILPRGDLADWVSTERALAADPGSADLKSSRDKHRTSTLATLGKSAAADIDGGTATLEAYVTALSTPAAKHRTDANTWTIVLTIVTIILLVRGKYGFIQTFSTVLVGLSPS